MSDEDKKPLWQRTLEQMSSPWDWVAGAAGAAAGAGATLASGGADLGSSVAAGFTTAIAGRKALAASFQRRVMRKRAIGLRKLLTDSPSALPQLDTLREELDLELTLWKNRATTNDEFSSRLDYLVDNYRKIVVRQISKGNKRRGLLP